MSKYAHMPNKATASSDAGDSTYISLVRDHEEVAGRVVEVVQVPEVEVKLRDGKRKKLPPTTGLVLEEIEFPELGSEVEGQRTLVLRHTALLRRLEQVEPGWTIYAKLLPDDGRGWRDYIVTTEEPEERPTLSNTDLPVSEPARAADAPGYGNEAA